MMIPASHHNLAGTLAYQLMGITGGGLPFPAPKPPSEHPEPPKLKWPKPERDADMPDGVSAEQWRTYQSRACDVVLGALTSGEPLSTDEISDRCGYSRAVCYRVLVVALALGKVSREKKRFGRGLRDFWRLV